MFHRSLVLQAPKDGALASACATDPLPVLSQKMIPLGRRFILQWQKPPIPLGRRFTLKLQKPP